MQPDDPVLVEDIVLEARDALEFTYGYDHDHFVADRRTRKAVAHSLQTIGEAASQLSASFKEAHPGVDWREIIAMRHRLVHGYRSVSYDIVWAVVVEELPGLMAALEPLLDQDGE